MVTEDWLVLLVALLVRLLVGLCLVKTWFVPDEMWQSLEPAHYLVFGYGILTWEWSRAALRSYAHVLPFALVFWILARLKLDTPELVFLAPKVLQCCMSALCDQQLYAFSRRLFGANAALLALASLWTNWFALYLSARPLANNAETLLLLSALNQLPEVQTFDRRLTVLNRHQLSTFVALSYLAVQVRPTSALVLAPYALCLFYAAVHCRQVPRFLRRVIPVFLICFSLATAIDRCCYGRWTLPWWNFLRFNVVEGGSAHFGIHPAHWYFTQGIPAVFGCHLLLIFFAISSSTRRGLEIPCALYLLVHSCLAHKEFRFLLPPLYILMPYAGEYLSKLTSKRSIMQILALMSLLNLPVLLYLGLRHQRGPLEVMERFRARRPEGPIWFLMPCHSTPAYSHLHWNVSLLFLSCEINWGLSEVRGQQSYRDEADRFYDNPTHWLHSTGLKKLGSSAGGGGASPCYLVMFEPIFKWMQTDQLLTDWGFDALRNVETVFYADFYELPKQSKSIYIWKSTNCNIDNDASNRT